MASWTTPTDQEIDRAVSRLTRPELATYFFRNLKNPLWLRPLRERGFFESPPAPEASERGMYSSPWPPADYLVQVAPDVPGDVAAIIASVHTENWIVQVALVEAALKLPPSAAAPLVGHLGAWMRSKYRHPLLPDRLADFVIRLAEGEETKPAISLAKCLLAVRPPERRPPDSYFPREPTGLVDLWDYRELIDKMGPALSSAASNRYVDMLFELLRTAVKHGIRADREPGDQKTDDRSHWWRPAVDDHVQNATGDVRDAILEALRDQLLASVVTDPSTLESVWRRLLAEPFSIFHRIGLFLLAQTESPPLILLEDAVFQHNWFNSPVAHHEYYHLLERHFGDLIPEKRNQYLEMVARTVRESEREYADWSEYRQLWPLRAYLEGAWKNRLDVLRQLGDLEHPDFLSYVSTGVGWDGPQSPKTHDELSAFSDNELVAFLRDWEPVADALREPNSEGLVHELATLVKSEPLRLSRLAPQFVALRAAYHRALFDGLQGALKAGHPFDWEPLLRLGKQAASTEDLSDEIRYGLLRLASLISSGLDKGEGEISLALRAEVWEIIALLGEYLDPGPEDDSHDSDDDSRPFDRSINTVRGEAMHASIRYGLWIRRSQEAQAGAAALLERGLEEMPELRLFLERHLDVSHDKSLAIRSVYGQWLPWLRLLDPRWTQRYIEVILPEGPALRPYRQAAWETYVTLSPPYAGMLSLLRDNYRAAVEDLASLSRATPERVRDANSRLAEHLAAFFWRGEVALDAEDNLVTRFYSVAPSWLRAHMTEFIGRSLKRSKEPLAAPIQERLMRLWDWRLSLLEGLADPEKQDELQAFVWWVTSESLPKEWIAGRLAKVSTIIPSTGNELMLALGEMGKLAQDFPSDIAVTMANLVNKDKDLWQTSARADDIAEVLRRLKSSGKKDVDQLVAKTADVLGRKGFLQFSEFASI